MWNNCCDFAGRPGKTSHEATHPWTGRAGQQNLTQSDLSPEIQRKPYRKRPRKSGQNLARSDSITGPNENSQKASISDSILKIRTKHHKKRPIPGNPDETSQEATHPRKSGQKLRRSATSPAIQSKTSQDFFLLGFWMLLVVAALAADNLCRGPPLRG